MGLGIRAMRIIDRYIFREILSHALLGLGVFTLSPSVSRISPSSSRRSRREGVTDGVA